MQSADFCAKFSKSGAAVPLVLVWRGQLEECVHLGHAVICDEKGQVIEAWGDPDALIYPRSSCKMIQALPLVEGGYAADLSPAQLALLCASHEGAALHREAVLRWLIDLGLSADDLRCGPQEPRDAIERKAVLCADCQAGREHNNCSGKHTGFLMLEQKIGGGPEYHRIDHPVQIAVKQAFEEVTDETSPTYGIDGCSAPNFACSLAGLAGAMGRFAGATDNSARGTAMRRLREAMASQPMMVAGKGRACTDLMSAMDARTAVKTGAEGVFTAICPDQKRGIAVKIIDGASRASEAVIAALLVRIGALQADDPVAQRLTGGPIRNWDGLEVGRLRLSAALLD